MYADRRVKAFLLSWILIVCSLCLPQVAEGTIRGLQPSLAQHYKEGSKTFKCLDGSAALPFAQVNDGYCDCPDGSDEPGKLLFLDCTIIMPMQSLRLSQTGPRLAAGTSACPTGRFFCRNRGHQALLLNASVVDDGICGRRSLLCRPGHILTVCRMAKGDCSLATAKLAS